MANRRIVERVVRKTRVSREEAERLDEIRRQAMEDFPPLESPPGIPSQIRAAREAKRMTWQAVAKAAGISHPGTVRDIEHGRDAHVSDLEAVARVLGLKLELITADA